MSQSPSPAGDASAAAAVAALASIASSAAPTPALHTPVFPAPLLDPLLAMGFSLGRAQRGLHATGSSSVEAAMAWALEHADDAGVDEPLRLPVEQVAPVAAAAPAAGAGASSPSPAAAASSGSSLVRFASLPPNTPYKLVLVVRTDLGMRTGKIAAQVAHAAVGTVMDLQEIAARSSTPSGAAFSAGSSSSAAAVRAANATQALHCWLEQGQAKVVLQARDQAELHSLAERARAVGLATHIVADAGRTQVAAGSETVLAVGPGPIAVVDSITGHLKLL